MFTHMPRRRDSLKERLVIKGFTHHTNNSNNHGLVKCVQSLLKMTFFIVLTALKYIGKGGVHCEVLSGGVYVERLLLHCLEAIA